MTEDVFKRLETALAAGGAAGLSAALARVKRSTEQARAEQEKYQAAMRDPLVRRRAGDVLATADATRRLAETTRTLATLDARRAAVASGQFARDLRARQLVHREQQRVLDLERRAGYEVRYGRLGGRVMSAADRLRESRSFQAAAGAVGAAGATAGAMAASGLSGTVEGNRLALEFQMISRELAGAMLPAVTFATRGLQLFRKWLESLSGSGQNLLMMGMLGAGAFGGLRMLRGGLGMLGLAGGGGAIAGGTGAAAAGGAMAATRTPFIAPLALGVMGGAMGYGSEVALGGLAYSAARGGLGGMARGLGGPLAVGALGYEAATGGYYEELRARGHSRLTAGLGAVGGAGMDIISSPLKWLGLTDETYGEAFRRRSAAEPRGDMRWATAGMDAALATFGIRRAPDAPEPRRLPTIADAGFVAPGGAYERMATRLAVTDAPGLPERDSPERLLSDILTLLRDTIGVRGGPPPPPMPGR